MRKSLPRSKKSKELLAQSWIKLGSTVHAAIVLGLFVAPVLLLARQLFRGEATSFVQIASPLIQNEGLMLVLLAGLLGAALLGRLFQSMGFKLIDALEKDDT